MSRLSRFANLFRHRALDTEFDDELKFHFEMRVEKNLRRGLSQADAEVEARRHLGSTLRAREGMREARIMMWIDTLVRDMVYGARLLSRQPGSSFLAVLTLSLGIGANAVIFSLLHAALLRPLPFTDADRLVAVVDQVRTSGRNVSPTVPELLDVRAASATLAPVSFFDVRDAQINGGTEPARALSARIDANFFGALGVAPALGRLFSQGDHESDRVVILSDAFWRRNFGANPLVVNRDIVINGGLHKVVGVLPAGVSFDYFTPEPIELYVPFPLNNPVYTSWTAEFAAVRRVIAVARLKPSTTIEQAAVEVETVSQRLQAAHAEFYRRGSDGRNQDVSMTVVPLRDIVVADSRSIVLILFAAVGLILLIACVNTAQFLLARAVERQPEVLIRSALGAGNTRLLRQFLTEAFLLAAIASVLGLLQAAFLVDVLRVLLASPSPLIAHLDINPTVILFSMGVTVMVTLACGLLPAIHVVRGRFISDSARLAGAIRSRPRHVMIAVQVAVSLVLLISAGLLAQGLNQLQNAPRGYDADQVTLMRLRISGGAGQSTTGAAYQQYLAKIAAIPGIAHAAVAHIPLPGFPGTPFAIAGRADDPATLTQQRASWQIVSGDYFNVLRIPMLAGRMFADTDIPSSPQVAIINEDMARRFWLNQNPIGQQITSGIGPRQRTATIIGVAANVRSPQQVDMVPQIYTSYLQQSEPSITVLIRPSAGMTVSAETVKQAVWSVEPKQPLFDIQPLTNVIDRATTTPRLMTRLLGSFATLALMMSTLGVYTIVSYLTARRSKEVALRRAIGASSQDVLRLLGVPTMRWMAMGAVVGLIAAIGAANVLSTTAARFAMPQDATRMDPLMVAVTAAVYVIVVAIAVIVPASRALRIQPATILRAE